MKPEEINIAIAEACGWQDIKPGVLHTFEHYGIHPDPDIGRTRVSNFYNDLNAMHEAEMTLSEPACHRFRNILGDICSNGHHTSDKGKARKAIHATAPQRAEAFLKTIGKWKE